MNVSELMKMDFTDSLAAKASRKGLVVRWVSADYLIEWGRVQTPDAVCEWVEHLCGKRGATPQRIGDFIRVVYARHGWELFKGA